jgi:hypothetical protein
MNWQTKISAVFAFVVGIAADAATDNQALDKFGERMSYFYLNPTKQQYDELQSGADRFAAAMQKLGNKSDVSTAAFFAKVSEKHNWDITGKSNVADMAREIRSRHSQLANYVEDDRQVDPAKLDLWWSSFFATGETKYLAKILRYAEPLKRTKHITSDLMIAYAATWSFKSNCGQHKAVAAFAKECLDSNAFPSKKDFLKECIAGPKRAGHYR